MKMKSEHFQTLSAAIQKVLLAHPDLPDMYRRGEYPNAHRTKDINMRFRWDLLWASRINVSEWYDYLNDTHIDTALRKIVPSL